MQKLKYKLALTDDAVLTGTAKEIAVRDALNVLTLRPSAPMMAVLQSGTLKIVADDDSVQNYPYEEGFLKAQDGECRITLLK